MVSDLYDHPDLYDALLPVKAHLPFYLDLARQQAGAVLELACGTGQLTVPIALDGHPTVGLDQSRAMLDVSTATFGPLCVEETRDYDPVAQVNRGTWYVSAPGKPDEWTVPLVLRSIFPQELPLLVSAAGLELTSRLGDLSLAPFGVESRSQVCLCRRVC